MNQLYHELTQDTFDRDHAARHHVERPFWELVARTVLGGPGTASRRASRVVVDLACGTGFVSGVLSKSLRGIDRLIAFDLSVAALHSTTRRRVTLVVGDGSPAPLAAVNGSADALPLADASVDLVALNAALHHMPDPIAVLRQVDRVLKPGGWFALGFEPNRLHFACSRIARMGRLCDRLAWYADPKENRRRLREWIGMSRCFAADSQISAVERVINDHLHREGLVDGELSRDALLDMVDPHARGADDAHAGFEPAALMRTVFAGYDVPYLKTSDYLGEAVRRSRWMRDLADAALRRWLPEHGSLFSWIIRKPGGEGAR